MDCHILLRLLPDSSRHQRIGGKATRKHYIRLEVDIIFRIIDPFGRVSHPTIWSSGVLDSSIPPDNKHVEDDDSGDEDNCQPGQNASPEIDSIDVGEIFRWDVIAVHFDISRLQSREFSVGTPISHAHNRKRRRN
jgi:hypothetical protein